MWIFIVILNIIFTRFCHALPPMTMWLPLDPNDNDAYEVHPTWYSVVRLADVFTDVAAADVNHEEVMTVAQQMYRSLEQAVPDWDERKTPGGFCLVAVIWDPIAQEFTASTIPQGARKADIVWLAGKEDLAPAWWQQVQGMINVKDPARAPLHAEDGAFFHWETRVGPGRVVNQKYTGPLLVGVYGRATEADGTEAVSPRVWSLCGKSPKGPSQGTREPRPITCQVVARNLGVEYVSPNWRRRDTSVIKDPAEDYENQGDIDGGTPTAEESAAAEADLSACSTPNAACSSWLSGQVASATPEPETIIASEASMASITAAPSLTTTASAVSKPSCSLQQQDPDANIVSRYCVCQSSITLPLLPIPSTAVNTEACDYTTLPGSSITTMATGFHSTTTNSALCEVCSQVEINEDACTTIPSCVPEAAKASVTVATSPLHVGTLTGDALYTGVSDALMSVCPPVTQTTSATQCSGTAVIKGITYIDDLSLVSDGELEVFAAFSGYNDTSLRNAMIQSIAQSAAKSATGKNCYDASYTVLTKRGHSESSSWYDKLFGRPIAVRDHPVPEHEEINLCNMAELALVNYYSQLWRLAPEPGPTDFIEAQYKFHATNGPPFWCEFLEALSDALAPIAPEFTIGEVSLGEGLTAVCQQLTGE